MRRDIDEILSDLEQPLDESRIKGVNVGHGQSAPYLEAWDVIRAANRVFGADGWSYRIIGAPTFIPLASLYMAEVEVTVIGVTRSDIGTNILAGGTAGPQPSHHEMSIKGAVSDALKRALRSFGAQFGNELYDKEFYPNLHDAGERPQQPDRGAELRPPQARPAAATQQQIAETGGGFRNAGDFFSWAWHDHKLSRDVVLQLLGIDARDLQTDGIDWALLQTRLNVRIAEIAASPPRAR